MKDVTNPANDPPPLFAAALVDLSDHGSNEVIVYLSGRSWCGSGGCNTLILAPQDNSYKIIGDISITRPPIRVLAGKTKGWHDLGVWVQGGGIQPGYGAKLQFDGSQYPRNPSVPPATPLKGKVAGTIAIPNDEAGKPVF